MKITRRDAAVILYLVAILSLILTRQLYYSPTIEETNTVLEECRGLQSQVNELEAKVEHQPVYEKEISDMEELISDIVARYPGSITEEEILMYVNELNEELDMGINSLSMGSKVPVYYIVGTGMADTYNYTTNSLSLSLNYSTDYNGLKKIINYINQDEEHRNIVSLSINASSLGAEDMLPYYDEEGELVTPEIKPITGAISINLFIMDGKENSDGDETPSKPVEIPEVEHGVDDIFRSTLEAVENIEDETSADDEEESPAEDEEETTEDEEEKTSTEDEEETSTEEEEETSTEDDEEETTARR